MTNRLNFFYKIYKKNRLKVKFLLAGGVNTMFGLGCFPLLYIAFEKLQIHYLYTLFLSQVMCILFSYITNKFFVFQTSKNYIKEFAKFSTFYLIFSILNIIYLPIMVEYYDKTPVFSQIIYSIFIIMSSYLWHKNISFKKRG